jgi:hypothetical protein
VSAAEIVAALGGGCRSGRWWRCVCPIHGSRTGHSLTLALRDHPRGLAVRCWAGCEREAIIAELRRRELLDGCGNEARSTLIPIRSDDLADAARRIGWARRIWDTAQDARGSPVVDYLGGRGIAILPPPSLRWTPSLRRLDGTHGPAMVARVENIHGGLIGISRTWLLRDDRGIWWRRDRAMLGCAAGGAVRLAPAAETLLVGEGLETVAAGMVATRLSGWAALSTSGLVALVLPRIVRTVLILADNDRCSAGQRAAHAAAQRWLAEGRRVRVVMAPDPSTDIADVLVAAAELHDVAA